jgi:formylmethanofuran dehydrogenase subunit E
MVIGLRMGLLALKTLDSPGWFNLHCRVRLRPSPPDSCVIDGLQSSTGCTLGKRNIEIEEGEGVASEFKSGGRVLRLTLKPEILYMIRSDPESGQWREYEDEYEEDSIFEKLIKARDETLFDISIFPDLDG